jgi:hypothetical protein
MTDIPWIRQVLGLRKSRVFRNNSGITEIRNKIYNDPIGTHESKSTDGPRSLNSTFAAFMHPDFGKV